MAEIVDEPEAARAYRMLSRMIVTLELPPGSETSEGRLIHLVRMGRTPVREAIQRLAWEGLVAVRPRAGLSIAPLAPGDWLRIVEARCALEPVITRSAARFINGENARNLHAAAMALRKAMIGDNLIAFFAAELDLQQIVAAATDNPFAARANLPLQIHSRRCWFRYQRDIGLAAICNRHLATIRALLDGDPAGAEQASLKLLSLLARHAEAALGD